MKCKKLYIFDLDDTISLREIENTKYKKEYEEKLKEKLKTLKKNNIKLAIATYNSRPETILTELRILHLFDIIYKPTELLYDEYISNYRNIKNATVWIMGQIAKICWNKGIMVETIMKDLKCSKDETIYFDDYINNVYDVKKLGVRSVYVNKKVGIPLHLLNPS